MDTYGISLSLFRDCTSLYDQFLDHAYLTKTKSSTNSTNPDSSSNYKSPVVPTMVYPI